MPLAVTETPYRPVPVDPPRKLWTRAECQVLESAGVFDQQRVELIEGELISKMGKKRLHTNALVFVQAWLIRVFRAEFVNPETPIDVAPEDNPTSEPQPDLIVLKRPSTEFQEGNPAPSDVRLVVEISDTTLGFDLTKKAALYARARILELWVLDVAARRLIVHRDPTGGRFQQVMAYGQGETVAPLAAPHAEFRFTSSSF